MSDQRLLGTAVKIVKNPIVPNAFSEEEFEHYSLPAFDSSGAPSIDKGCTIESNKFLVKNSNILISKLNPRIKRVWEVQSQSSQRRKVCSTEFICLEVSQEHDVRYIYHLLHCDEIYNVLRAYAVGTTNSHVRYSPQLLLTIKAYLPNYKIQRKLSLFLDTIDRQIKPTQALVDKYITVKQGMMSDLFSRGIDTSTGELRPSFAEAPELYKETEFGVDTKRLGRSASWRNFSRMFQHQ